MSIERLRACVNASDKPTVTLTCDTVRAALDEMDSCGVTVGGGLTVYGTMEAIGRVQAYILLDSTHPVEKEDVRRSLMRQLVAAEAKVERMTEALTQCGEWFREYEASHRVKVIPDFLLESQINDTLAKAERNRERAELCEFAVRGPQ